MLVYQCLPEGIQDEIMTCVGVNILAMEHLGIDVKKHVQENGKEMRSTMKRPFGPDIKIQISVTVYMSGSTFQFLTFRISSPAVFLAIFDCQPVVRSMSPSTSTPDLEAPGDNRHWTSPVQR